jgi:hypothetical protein
MSPASRAQELSSSRTTFEVMTSGKPTDRELPAGPWGRPTIVDEAMLRRTTAGTAVGNMVEWYDFGVYSYIAVTLGRVFFPAASPSAQLISTFATFAAAFLVRPFDY